MIDQLYAILGKFGFNEPLHSPVTHMPIGLTVGAFIFFIVAIFFKKKTLVLSARHASILAFIFAFPTILLGVIDWIHFYNATLFTPILIKMALAAFLLIILGAVIILGSEIKLHSIIMTIMYALAFIAVMSLGYYGSGIIYGRGLQMKTPPAVKIDAGKTDNIINIKKNNRRNHMTDIKKFFRRILYFTPVIILLVMQPLRVYSHISGNTDTQSISIDEKPGNIIPMDLQFINEYGTKIALRDAVKGPTILTLLYYRCPNACSIVVSSLALALRNSNPSPGKEPNIVTLSFNEIETPADAMKTKKIAFEIIQKPFPLGKWSFLTGSKDNIKKISDAVGFRFVKTAMNLIIRSAFSYCRLKAKWVRYIMGTDYLPIDLTMSLMEASTGTIKPTISRVLRFCLSYDPKSHTYVFNILRISAIVISTLAVVFIAFLVISGMRRQKRISGEIK